MRNTLLCILICPVAAMASEGAAYDRWRIVLNGDPAQQAWIGTVGDRVVRLHIQVAKGKETEVYMAYNPLDGHARAMIIPDATDLAGFKAGDGLTGSGRAIPLAAKRIPAFDSGTQISCGIKAQGGVLSGSITLAGTSYAVAGTVVRGAQAASDDAITPEASWPRVGGPNGDYTAPATAKPPAIAKNHKAWRLQWISQDIMPASSSGMRMLVMPSGGSAGPILHRGRIHQYYYVPAGPIIDDGLTRERNPVVPPWNRTLADDVMVAIDPATGATLWRTVVPLAGVTYTPHKPEMQGHTMVGDGDRVYAIGSAGMVYALDAATGTVVWKAPSPLDAKLAKAAADMAASGTRAQGYARPRNRDSGHSPAIAEGVLLVPSLAGTGLAGMDGTTGKVLWQRDGILAKCASPLVWKSAKGELVVAVGRTTGEKAEARDVVACIDPRTGRDIWVSEPLGAMMAGATLNGDHIYVNVGAAGLGPEARLACMKLTPSGLEHMWQAGDAAKGGIFSMVAGSQAMRLGDAVYARVNPQPGKVGVGVFDAATGDVRRITLPWDAFQETAGVGMPGLLIWPREWQHGESDPFIFDGEGSNLGQWFLPAIHVSVTPYQVPWAGSPILVDGRYILRAMDGLYCYDLRTQD